MRSSSYGPYTDMNYLRNKTNKNSSSTGTNKKNIVVQLNTQSLKGDSKRSKSLSLRDDIGSENDGAASKIITESVNPET